MQNGRQWEPLMTKGPDDPLAARILAAGEPSFEALASAYPGKILDRTVIGTWSDPGRESKYNDEFAVYWNGAIAANLIKGARPLGHNTILLIRVGAAREIFGTDRAAFTPVHYQDGYLPLVTGAYIKDEIEYRETVFASQPQGETEGWDVATLDLTMTNRGRSAKKAAAAIDVLLLDGTRARYESSRLFNAAGALLATASASLRFDPARQQFIADRDLAPGESAGIRLRIPYLPDAKGLLHPPAPDPREAEREEASVRQSWQALLDRGAQIDVPEPRVNDVWRSLLLQNFILADGPRFTYGSGLWYNDSTYPQENGFAAHVFALYGHPAYADALQRSFIAMSVTPQGAGRKYQNRRAMVLHHLLEDYRLTGSRDLFDRFKNDYYRVADEIVSERRGTMTAVSGEKPLYWGLLPPDKPGVDLPASTQTVYVLGHNITNCQGLLDFGRFLVTSGIDPDRGSRYLREGADFRQTLMSAMRRAAIRVPGRPPFVDLQTLFFRDTPDYGPEPYDDLALGRLQGTYFHYWVDMEFHYNFFNPTDDVGQWLADYVQQRNGFVLGLTRARGQFAPQYGWINNVYDGGYYNYRLRQGDTDRFLLGLYSRLAFGMSRNLYVASEGSPFIGYNTQKGGFVGAAYSFPNSAANADTLLMLRNALVFEDLHDNVETGTLVLMGGAPRAWFSPGKSIRVSRLRTYFGDLSYDVTASSDGQTIEGHLAIPAGQGLRDLVLHLRHPGNPPILKATVNGQNWTNFNSAGETLTLPAGLKQASFQVTYRP